MSLGQYTKVKDMTIQVTGCHDCPFYKFEYECGLTYINVAEIGNNYNNAPPENCPLKQQPITIKLKEDDNERIHTERG